MPTWPELDYKLFWYDVAEARKGRVHREPVTQVWQLLGFRSFWSLNKENFSLACDEVVSHLEMQDCLMALSMAFNIYAEHSKPASWEIQLRQAVDGNPELSAHLETLLNPPKREPDKWQIKMAEWEEEANQRKAEEAERRRIWRESLAADLTLINSPEPGVMTHNQGRLPIQLHIR
ncbi:hypothetical protein [Pseudomonas sp. NUPR-001]|uniref:hypothetical protein n=1 Tax=Pseudomonas sp. NUPR-001 TaxID=3416058 RepID=UPI003F948A00